MGTDGTLVATGDHRRAGCGADWRGGKGTEKTRTLSRQLIEIRCLDRRTTVAGQIGTDVLGEDPYHVGLSTRNGVALGQFSHLDLLPLDMHLHTAVQLQGDGTLEAPLVSLEPGGTDPVDAHLDEATTSHQLQRGPLARSVHLLHAGCIRFLHPAAATGLVQTTSLGTGVDLDLETLGGNVVALLDGDPEVEATVAGQNPEAGPGLEIAEGAIGDEQAVTLLGSSAAADDGAIFDGPTATGGGVPAGQGASIEDRFKIRRCHGTTDPQQQGRDRYR